jgi:hypothetical protein
MIIEAAIALLACSCAFVVPVLMILLVVLGFADWSLVKEILPVWFSFMGPFAGAVFGFYFNERSHRPKPRLNQGNR